jgi:hypothetical protein
MRSALLAPADRKTTLIGSWEILLTLSASALAAAKKRRRESGSVK